MNLDIDPIVNALREAIKFDALVLGTGTRTSDGSVKIGEVYGCYDSLDKRITEWHEIDETFVEEYHSVAAHDVVGQLFAAYPRIVQLVSISEYEELENKTDLEHGGTAGVRDGRKVADYLKPFGISHLMLCGIDSSFGLTWVTLYRRSLQSFDNDDVEKARYIVPALVYAWQRNAHLPRQWEIDDMPTRLLPLTFREMRIAILASKGNSCAEIAAEVDNGLETVRKVVQNLRVRLGVSKLMLEAFEGSRRER